MYILATFVFASLGIASAREAIGSACSVSNNHLDANTKEFITDCDSFGYCSVQGICMPRGCRRDEFVLTSLLKSNNTVPPLCPSGTFCPDDASGCLPLVEVGGRCQLNRDGMSLKIDECAPAPGYALPDLTDPWRDPYTGSTCLNGICRWANVSLGGTCTSESTTYIGYDVSGMSFTNTIVRDDCIEHQGFCVGHVAFYTLITSLYIRVKVVPAKNQELNSNTCIALKPLDDSCNADRECQSYNCNSEGKCAIPPEAAVRVPKWVYALISLGLAFCMVLIISLLVLMHRRAQTAKRIMLDEYYKEQTGYRNSIISFHSALASRSTDSLEKDKIDAGNGQHLGWEKQPMMRSMSDMSDATVVDRRRT